MKTLFPSKSKEEESLVKKALVFGGMVSPEYAGIIRADAVKIAGDEIVEVIFVDSNNAKSVAEKLKDIGFPDQRKKGEDYFLYDGKMKLLLRPYHLLFDPLNSSEWKMKVSYKPLEILSKEFDIYYNFETGEIIVDNTTDETLVRGIFFTFNNKPYHYVMANKEMNYVAIGNVEIVPRT